MVKRFLGLLNKEISGLHEAAFLLGLAAIFSQILALLRDRLLAHSLGAGSQLDVYYASFKIPDFLYISVASFVSITVLIPFLVKKIGDGEKQQAKEFLNNVFTVFIFVMVVVSAVAFFVMPFLADLIVPGFTAEAKINFVLFSRILLLQTFFLGLSNLLASVTQSLRKFFVYALSPVLYNLGIIFGILFLLPSFGIKGLVSGVVFGAILHFLIQAPVVMRSDFFPKFTLAIKVREIRNVVMVSLPRTLTLGAHQIVLLVLVAIASFMAEGSIAIFNFSFNLQSVPLAVIGVSYSVAAFPTLSKLFSEGQSKEFVGQITTAARHIIFWSLPIISLFVVLRAQIVRTILGSGAFDWADTRLTAAALALFAISIFAQGLNLLFVRGYYAAGNTKKPLFINVFSSVVIILLAFTFNFLFNTSVVFREFLESLLRVNDLSGTNILVLPLAFSIGVLVNILIFWVAFQKDFSNFTDAIRKTFAHAFYAAILMGFVTYFFLGVFDNVFDINTFVGIFAQGFISGIFGIIVGVFLLKLLKNKEISDLQQAIRRKFWRQKPILPGPEEI